jgi:hypothetical protein
MCRTLIIFTIVPWKQGKALVEKASGTAYLDTVYVVELDTEIGSMIREGGDTFPTPDASHSSNLQFRPPKDSPATDAGLTISFPPT